MSLVLLIVGFFLLIKGADLFVSGSSNIAKYFKIPTIVIGLTLVALGTSAPEAAVSIVAAINKSGDLSISNIIGSNIFNLFFVLGFTALFKNVKTTKKVVNNDYYLSILSIVILLFLVMTTYFNYGIIELSRVDGFILLCVLLIYLICMIKGIDKTEKKIEKVDFSIKDVFLIILGLILVIFGGNLTVNSAVQIARVLGMSETLIGLTIVSVGTSLPEFTTSVVALIKGENDIAVGNVIGSNIFNILFILGISSFISPMMIGMTAIKDLMVLLLGTIGLLYFLRDLRINRKEGIFMLLFYVAYCFYIFLR